MESQLPRITTKPFYNQGEFNGFSHNQKVISSESQFTGTNQTSEQFYKTNQSFGRKLNGYSHIRNIAELEQLGLRKTGKLTSALTTLSNFQQQEILDKDSQDTIEFGMTSRNGRQSVLSKLNKEELPIMSNQSTKDGQKSIITLNKTQFGQSPNEQSTANIFILNDSKNPFSQVIFSPNQAQNNFGHTLNFSQGSPQNMSLNNVLKYQMNLENQRIPQMYFDKSKKRATLHPDAGRVLQKNLNNLASRKMSQATNHLFQPLHTIQAATTEGNLDSGIVTPEDQEVDKINKQMTSSLRQSKQKTYHLRNTRKIKETQARAHSVIEQRDDVSLNYRDDYNPKFKANPSGLRLNPNFIFDTLKSRSSRGEQQFALDNSVKQFQTTTMEEQQQPSPFQQARYQNMTTLVQDSQRSSHIVLKPTTPSEAQETKQVDVSREKLQKLKNQLSEYTKHVKSGIQLREGDENDQQKAKRVTALNEKFLVSKTSIANKLVDKLHVDEDGYKSQGFTIANFPETIMKDPMDFQHLVKPPLKIQDYLKYSQIPNSESHSPGLTIQNSNAVSQTTMLIERPNEPDFRHRESKLSKQEQQFVKMIVQDIDRHAINRKKDEANQKKMFKDPKLFEQDTDNDENSQTEHQDQFSKNLMSQNIMKKEQEESILDDPFKAVQIPSSKRREQIRARKQFDQQIEQVKSQIESTIQNQTQLIPKAKKKKFVDSDTEDEQGTQKMHTQQSPGSDDSHEQEMLDKQLGAKQSKAVGTFINGLTLDSKINKLKQNKVEVLQQELKQLEKAQKLADLMFKKKKKSIFNSKVRSRGSDDSDQDANQMISESIVNKMKKKAVVAQNKVAVKSLGNQLSPTKKKKNRWQMIVRKHFMQKKGLNLQFLTRVVNMQDKIEFIFKERNLGEKYQDLGINMWKNDLVFELQAFLKTRGVKFEIPFPRTEMIEADEQNQLFSDDVQRLSFYNLAKGGLNHDRGDKEDIAAQKYFSKFLEMQELPLPNYAQLKNNCLFLSEFKITDTQASALKHFLINMKSHPKKFVKKLFIDDCGMTDSQFTQILQGVEKQDKKLNVLIYSNSDIGHKSINAMIPLVSSLRELQINNMVKGLPRSAAQKLLQACLVDGMQLQKLKISKVLLNDDVSIELVCEMIRTKEMLSHIDVSWCGLYPSHLRKISDALLEKHRCIRNLNISYNSLNFESDSAKDENQISESEKFIENMAEYLQLTKTLNHIDFSGMGITRDYIMPLAEVMCTSDSLVGIHLNDLGFSNDRDLALDVLDLFILDTSDVFRNPEDVGCHKNRRIQNPQRLRDIVRKFTNEVTSKEVENQNLKPETYQKHILQSKQGKKIQNNKIINQTQVSQGIGRIESSLVDNFVLTRNLNEPELIFNQCEQKDMYFEQDSGELWRLCKNSECHVCQKHKLTVIYYMQPDHPGTQASGIPISNEGLIEITDPVIIESVKEELSMNHHELYNSKEPNPKMRGDVAPFITGSVIKGGYNRKLKMMRADLFAALSICNSEKFVTEQKQTNAIKKGIEQLVIDSQNILVQDCLQYLKGWEYVLSDKFSNNTVTDLMNVNMPDLLVNLSDDYEKLRIIQTRKPSKQECRTYNYAAYLHPGLHHFLIFDPVSNKVFCKDVVVELSCSDPNPDFPQKYIPPVTEEKPVKRTRANVWRKWKEPTEQDLQDAFIDDIQVDFNPELFIKDPEDIQGCLAVFQDFFDIIRVVFIEGQATSPNTFPEISMEKFIQLMLSQQTTDQMRNSLPRAFIENCFIRATRGDEGQGTLCRGEYMELLLRLCVALHPKQTIADKLETFLDQYLTKIYQSSIYLQTRIHIRASKQLNQLLIDNAMGLRSLYTENKEIQGFTLNSANNVLLAWTFSLKASHPHFIQSGTIYTCFVYSQQTNLHDLSKNKKYETLELVEYFEFLTRIALHNFRNEQELSIAGKVYKLLQRMWEYRRKNKPKKDASKGDKKKKKAKKFPDLIEVLSDESESD